MLFCPECKKLLKPQQKKDKKIMICMACGYTFEDANIKLSESIHHESIPEFDLKKHDVTLPITKETCPKCEHSEAHYMTKQTRAADEPPTRIFQCVKCRHRWREY